MNLKLLIGLALLASLGTAHADSLPELLSRCGNDAAVFFARQKQLDYEVDKSISATDYEDHYSEAMKGCFIVIKSAVLDTATIYELFDVNAHHRLGYFRKIRTDNPQNRPGGPLKSMECDFGGVECSSEAEWRAKVQPYVPGWKGS
jgi:hypothetical protein